MPTVQVPNGEKLLTTAHGQAILWLPLGVKIRLDVTGPEVSLQPIAAEDGREIVSDEPAKVSVSDVRATPRSVTFSLTAKTPGTVTVRFRNVAGAEAGSLVALAGEVKNHPGMEIDLIADVCRGADTGKTIAVQQILYNMHTSPFDQNNDANINTYGRLACGKIVKGRGTALFGSVSPIFYEKPYHEPLSAVKSRDDVKYKSEKITRARNAIKASLAKGIPARAGILYHPVGMHVQDRKLIAYYAGGHTVLIVGCDSAAKNFLYIDPWPGGSTMDYKGGIDGVTLSEKCKYMGILSAEYDAERAVASDKGHLPNLVRQDYGTQGTFSDARGTYLELVAGPIPG